MPDAREQAEPVTDPIAILGELAILLRANPVDLPAAVTKLQAHLKDAQDGMAEWSQIYESTGLCYQCSEAWDEAAAEVAGEDADDD